MYPRVRIWLRSVTVAALSVTSAAVVFVPAAHAATSPDVSVILGPGQSRTVARIVGVPTGSVTPVATCDPGVSISFDAQLNETVSVAPDTGAGVAVCTVDFQVAGQSIGFLQHVTVTVPGLSVSDVTVTESDAGTVPATFTVTMSTASDETVTAAFATVDGTAGAPADYGSVAGTVTFAPGQTSRTLTVAVAGDTLDEVDETFSVELSDGSGAAITDEMGVATILDEDRNGAFACRAVGLDALGSQTAVANPAGTPCQDDVQQDVAEVSTALFTLTVDGLTATTDQAPGVLAGTAPSAGDHATATAGPTAVTIVTADLVTIRLEVTSSSATAACVATPDGLVPQFTGSSTITGLTVAGLPISVGSQPTDVPLLIGTLHLNDTVRTGTSVTQRPVWLQTVLGDVVVDTATAGVQGTAAHPGGNPCVTR